MRDYRDFLIVKCDYSEYEAELTNEDLNSMDEECIAVLEKFINGDNVDDFAFNDICVRILVEKYKLSTIAAILSIYLLKKDYDGYMKILNSNK